MDDDERPEVVAWQRFCRKMEALGTRILEDDFPDTADAPTEGIAHLAAQVSCWLGWSISHADPAAPFFHRSNDLFTPWGGPNQDNTYRHARIDPSRRYRIRGEMRGCEHFALTLRVGFMHMPEWGTKASRSSVELGIEQGDRFEILLGGDGGDPACIEIPPEVTTVSLREYYTEWQPIEPAVFTIECLDPDPPRPRSGEELASQIDHALEQTERSLIGWNDYLRERKAKAPANAFLIEGQVAKGLSAARYAFLFWALRPDEALIVETDVPDARYWGMQLARLGWFAPIDPVHRVTSINHRQVFIDDDGRARFVLAHTDPGVPNWLDVGGHVEGLLTARWFWSNGDPPMTTRVVAIDGVRASLPPETPVVTASEREQAIAARRAHLAWRFRT